MTVYPSSGLKRFTAWQNIGMIANILSGSDLPDHLLFVYIHNLNLKRRRSDVSKYQQNSYDCAFVELYPEYHRKCADAMFLQESRLRVGIRGQIMASTETAIITNTMQPIILYEIMNALMSRKLITWNVRTSKLGSSPTFWSFAESWKMGPIIIYKLPLSIGVIWFLGKL